MGQGVVKQKSKGPAVLISSVSKKVPLVKAVRRSLRKIPGECMVIGGDADPECIGKYFVDDFWEMPLLSELPIEKFIADCRRRHVKWVIPTRDGEMSYYADHKRTLEEHGIHAMVSDASAVKACLDKLEFYQMMKRSGFPAISTAKALKGIQGTRFVVKERYGAGGRDIGLCLTRASAEKHAKSLRHPVFQPYVSGKEMSVDLYRDRKRRVKGVVARWREVVVAGESQVTSTFRNSKVEEMCARMADSLGLYGHAVFQLIYDEEKDAYHVLECNPRFGGASTLGLAAGLDSFAWFFQETLGVDIGRRPFRRAKDGICQVRYAEDLLLR